MIESAPCAKSSWPRNPNQQGFPVLNGAGCLDCKAFGGGRIFDQNMSFASALMLAKLLRRNQSRSDITGKNMAQSLDSFMAELRADADKFEAAYRKKVEENPEHYPLEMNTGNEGLWFEFFMTYAQSGEV